MTICISAIADNGNSIVCVADKMLSFGDYVQWDSDVTKIIPISNSNAVGLIAGSVSHCSAVLAQLGVTNDFGKDVAVTAMNLKTIYRATFAEFQETTVLHRHGIDRAIYQKLLSSKKVNRVVEKVAEEMADFEDRKWDCDLMVCGFDSAKRPYIIAAVSPGNVLVQTTQGFHSIGIASGVANARLLFDGHEREHPFGRVLFDVFDAKVSAEMTPGVGFDWDAQIIFENGRRTLSKKLKKELEAGWDTWARSPFEDFNRDEYLQKPKGWPKKWRDRIVALKREDLEIV